MNELREAAAFREARQMQASTRRIGLILDVFHQHTVNLESPWLSQAGLINYRLPEPLPHRAMPQASDKNPNNVDFSTPHEPGAVLSFALDRTAPAKWIVPVLPPDQGEPPPAPLPLRFEDSPRKISESTATQYHRHYARLVRQAAHSKGIDPAFVTPADLVHEVYTDPALGSGTKKTYRAALAWMLEQPEYEFDPQERAAGLTALQAFSSSLSHQSCEQVPKLEPRNSRVRGRSIPKEDLGPLLDALLSARFSNLNWASQTTAWLIAGIETGARPGEWEMAYWLDREQWILRIPNLKLKNHPPFSWAHIPMRLLTRAEADLAEILQVSPAKEKIFLSAAKRQAAFVQRNLAFFDEVEARTDGANHEALHALHRLRAWELQNKELAWRDVEVPYRRAHIVDTQITNVQEYMAGGTHHTFERFFNGCRTALAAACKRAFPDGRRYSLYDTRSTALANMQARIGPEVASMVLGHYLKRRR